MHWRRRSDGDGGGAALTRPRAILGGLGLTLAACALAAYRIAPETEPAPLAITARAVALDPNDPTRDRVGRLRYLGGLDLRATDRHFGGLSGMRFLPSGQLLAIGDEGSWFTFALREEDEQLVGIAHALLARMPDLTGRPLRARVEADAEALELGPDGERVVGFQRHHRIWTYDPDDGRPRPRAFPDPTWLERLPSGGGISSIARVGALWLFLAEDPGTGAWNGILQGGGALSTSYGRVTYRPAPGFAPTDAAALDATHVLLLERLYSRTNGVAARIVRVSVEASHLALGRADALATIEWPLSVDNMKAIAVRRVKGRTFIYVASGDNFSPLQRTLLLKFELMGQ